MLSTSKTKFSRVTQLFPEDNLPEMHGKMARLCVLQEDMRLEITAIYDDDFLRQGNQTLVKKEARQLYFTRKLIGTIQEFSGGIIELDRDADFKHLKRSFRSLSTWTAAVKYYQGGKDFIKKVRNDIGGHFKGDATSFALGELYKAERGKYPHLSGQIGSIEYCPPEINPFKDCTGRIHVPLRLHFTSHIVAAALLKQPSGATPEEKIENPLDAFVRAHGHAYDAMMVLVSEYLWDRLKD